MLIIDTLVINQSFNGFLVVVTLINVIHIDSVDVSLVKSEAAHWHNSVYLSDHNLGSFDHVLVEVSGCSHELQISIGISSVGLDESEVSPNRVFSDILLSIEVFNLGYS